MFPDMFLRDRRERWHGGPGSGWERGHLAGPLLCPHTPSLSGDGGQGWPGCPQGATYSRRRLGSPWKTLALRQPMRLLERSLQGEWRGHQGWGCLTVPAGVPRASPGWSEGRPRHLQPLQLGEAEEGARLDCADQVVLQVPAGRQTRILGCAVGAPSPGNTAQGARPQPLHPSPHPLPWPRQALQPLLISSSPSHFSLVISPRDAGKALRCSGGCQPLGTLWVPCGAPGGPARWNWLLAPAAGTHCSRTSRVPPGYLLCAG